MERREEDAIVLDAEVAGEADRRVALLTVRGELVRALAPAAARSRRRFGGAVQPGARVRARWTLKGENAPAVLEEATLLAEPPTPDPLDRYYIAAHVLETATAFAREGQEDPRLYRLVTAVLERLAAGDAADPLARYFEAWTLRLAGLLPELHECTACGAALGGRSVRLAAEGGAFCAAHAPAAARSVGPSAAAWLEATRGHAPEDLPPLPASPGFELAKVLPGLITDFLERPLRALPALQRMRRVTPPPA